MHNGTLTTLDQVVWFYADGGGRARGVEVDPHIIPIELNAQEREDLVAFLYALTDESAMPEVPASVPADDYDRDIGDHRWYTLLTLDAGPRGDIPLG